MPKLPVVNGREVIRALERAGFLLYRRVGSHVSLWNPDTRRGATVTDHGSKDLPPGTLRGIIRDAGLTVEEFRRLLK